MEEKEFSGVGNWKTGERRQQDWDPSVQTILLSGMGAGMGIQGRPAVPPAQA